MHDLRKRFLGDKNSVLNALHLPDELSPRWDHSMLKYRAINAFSMPDFYTSQLSNMGQHITPDVYAAGHEILATMVWCCCSTL